MTLGAANAFAKRARESLTLRGVKTQAWSRTGVTVTVTASYITLVDFVSGLCSATSAPALVVPAPLSRSSVRRRPGSQPDRRFKVRPTHALPLSPPLTLLAAMQRDVALLEGRSPHQRQPKARRHRHVFPGDPLR